MSNDLAESILAEVRALRAEVAALKAPALPEAAGLSRAEAMQIVGAKSATAFVRFCAASKLRPYLRGKYRRADVIAAMNRLSVEAHRR